MKKMRLNSLKLDGSNMLSTEEKKITLGGYRDDQCTVCYTCEGGYVMCVPAGCILLHVNPCATIL